MRSRRKVLVLRCSFCVPDNNVLFHSQRWTCLLCDSFGSIQLLTYHFTISLGTSLTSHTTFVTLQLKDTVERQSKSPPLKPVQPIPPVPSYWSYIRCLRFSSLRSYEEKLSSPLHRTVGGLGCAQVEVPFSCPDRVDTFCSKLRLVSSITMTRL